MGLIMGDRTMNGGLFDNQLGSDSLRHLVQQIAVYEFTCADVRGRSINRH